MTGLEPATSGVTGRHSNQLSYTRAAMYVRFLDYLKSLVYQHYPYLSQTGNFPSGASDGARTRDLRRDRPAL